MNITDLKMDRKTTIRVKRLAKAGYPNPIERANFEKLPLDKLEKLLYIAGRVKKRRLENRESEIKSNPITLRIRNINDAFSFANELLESSNYAENLNTGLVGEGVLVASYSKIPLHKLDIEILELCKEIKRKKDYKRVIYDAGNVDKLVDSVIPISDDRGERGI